MHWLDMTDRIQFRIAITVYRCLHGTAPEYLSELFVPASTRSSRHCLRSSATSSSCCQLNCLHMDGVLLLHQAQLCGTASTNTSETQHYPLIHLSAILKHTYLLDTNLYTWRLSALKTLWLHALYKFFIVISPQIMKHSAVTVEVWWIHLSQRGEQLFQSPWNLLVYSCNKR